MTEETGVVTLGGALDTTHMARLGGYDRAVENVTNALSQPETIFVAHTDKETGKQSYRHHCPRHGCVLAGAWRLAYLGWPRGDRAHGAQQEGRKGPVSRRTPWPAWSPPTVIRVSAYGMATLSEPRNKWLTIPQLASLAETRACGKVMRRAWGAVIKPAINRASEGKGEYEVLPAEPVPDGAGGEVHVSAPVEEADYRDVVDDAPLSMEELQALAEVMTDQARRLRDDGASSAERKSAHAEAIAKGLSWSKEFNRYRGPRRRLRRAARRRGARWPGGRRRSGLGALAAWNPAT